MVPRLRDILSLLEEVAPAILAEEWDNPGLQVGSYSQEITKIFIALDPTLKAVRSASRRDARLLLTHHPLIFVPISRLDINTYPGNVVLEAARSRISVVSAHTNLDFCRGGISDILADLFGLRHVEVLKDVAGADGAGLGRIGDLSKPNELSVVAETVKRILGTNNIRVVSRGDPLIRRVAVVGGSGGGKVSLAFDKGADLLLTGDINHHHALEAESLGIALIDGGHFHMEKKAFGLFSGCLKEMSAARGWDVIVEHDEEEADPMQEG